MKIIKCLSECIEAELDMAECYIKKAVEFKDTYPDASKTFYNASMKRVEAIKPLHDQVVSLINAYRAKEGEPPAPMAAIYDYMHERHMDKISAVKRLQELYNAGL